MPAIATENPPVQIAAFVPLEVRRALIALARENEGGSLSAEMRAAVDMYLASKRENPNAA